MTAVPSDLPRPCTALPAQAAYAIIDTAWGVCAIVWTQPPQTAADPFAQGPPPARLARICAPGVSIAALRAYCQKMHPGCREVLGNGGHFHPDVVPEWFGELVGYLQNYYATGLRNWNSPRCIDNWACWTDRLDWSQVTPFQKRVLEVLVAIPRGECLTYGKVAARIGKPAAARAVGAAIASNPWPVLVPCHRVIGANGKLIGFSAPGGVAAKRRMLAMEHP